MSWVFVDDHANEDERLCDAGGLAAWYHTAGAHGFCRRKEHLRRPDGKALDFVPEAAALGLCASYTASQAKACLAALLRVGLWERVDGGYRLVRFPGECEACAHVFRCRLGIGPDEVQGAPADTHGADGLGPDGERVLAARDRHVLFGQVSLKFQRHAVRVPHFDRHRGVDGDRRRSPFLGGFRA